MGKIGLLDLPPELRNRIFALSIEADRNTNEAKLDLYRREAGLYYKRFQLGMDANRHLNYKVRGGKVEFLGSNLTRARHNFFTANQSKPGRLLRLLAIDRQTRAEIAPVLFHPMEFTIECHATELEIIATWVGEQITLMGGQTFEHDLKLVIRDVVWESLDCVWPLVRLAHEKRIDFSDKSWDLYCGRKRLQHVFVEAVKYGKRAGAEGKSESAMKKGYEKLLRAAAKGRGMTRKQFYASKWLPQ